MECEFCKKIFSTKGVLVTHQKTAKFCINIQTNINNTNNYEKYICNYCDKDLTHNSSLQRHLNICKVKKLEDLKINYEKQLQDQQTNYEKQLQDQQTNYERQITELKIQIEKLQDTIASIAAQPKTVNHNNTTKTNNNNNSRINVINNLAPMTDDEYKKLGDMLQRSHLERGADGFAELAIQFFQGKAVCTDLSRRMVTHKDAEGRVVSDPNMTRLTTKFFGGLMDKNRELTLEILTDLQKRLEDKEIDYEEFMNILVRFSDQKFNVRKLADGDEKNEPTDEKGEYLQFKNTYVNKVCDKIYVKNN
uniref:C2H2-type domain-containing protein n=1 Tax=viral metagenome TaxID=1070528 RepID=A0A6C0CY52_9ZZZZ